MTGSSLAPGARLRAASAADAPTMIALLEALLGATPYEALVRSRLDAGLVRTTADLTAITAIAIEMLGAVQGFALHGFVPGAEHAGMLHFVGVSATHRRQGFGRALVRASMDRLTRDGARFAIAELPGDAMLRPGEALLRHEGFEPEARIRDLYRDGVDLVILRRWLRPG